VKAVEKEIVSGSKSKPIRDEETLAKILEAAYVMQERNRKLQKADPHPKVIKNQPVALGVVPPIAGSSNPSKAGSTFALAQIVEIQHQLQVQHLDFESAMSLVVERLTQIAETSSAAIGLLEGQKVRYRAAAGGMALRAGTEVPLDKALSAECLQKGEPVCCADVAIDPLLDSSEFRLHGIQAMIAVPVFHDRGVAGSLDWYFPRAQAFTDEDVHTCQLLAGLVGEALAKHEKATWKQSLATERAVMLEALEKLKPNLAAFSETPKAMDASAPSSTSAETYVCQKCRHELVRQEQFCGNCGLPRSSNYGTPNLQSTIATLWHMQEAMNKSTQAPANGAASQMEGDANCERDAGPALVEHSTKQKVAVNEAYSAIEPYATAAAKGNEVLSEPAELPPTPVSIDYESSARADLEIPPHAILEDDIEDAAAEEIAVEAPAPSALAIRPVAWSSAATTRAFLEQLAAARDSGKWSIFWQARKGDIYLAVAILLMLGVIRWAVSSRHTVGATGSRTAVVAGHKVAQDAGLSLFDRMLVTVGLAEAPEPPEDKGNPRAEVWVDLQTALYYCPGADLYGKTPKGKFSSQRNAQLDQFQPAYRKACD
jgi:hypothetical protein